MSGLFAMASERPVSHEVVLRATRKLHHRGPESTEVWVSPRKTIGLGYTHLITGSRPAIVQPRARRGGAVRAMLDGNLYETEPLRRDLANRGRHPETTSDGELLIHLYEEYGLSFLRMLRGEFSFILWDGRNQLLLAARDRLGVRPLFYSHGPGVTYLGSECKALLEAGVPARWDRDSFLQEIADCEDGTRTLFQNITPVPPGHHLVLFGGQLQLRKYWDFDFPGEHELLEAREEVHVEQLRSTLDEVIGMRARGDVPVAVSLSGGLDSSCILGMASRHQPRLQAFTISFPDTPGGNEEEIARESCERLGITLQCMVARRESEADSLADAIYYWEDLPRGPLVVNKFLLSRFLAGRGVRVVLDGQGADSLFAGQGDKVDRGPLDGASTEGLHLMRRILGFVPAPMKAASTRFPFWRSLFSADFAGTFGRRDVFLVYMAQFDVPGQLEGRAHSSMFQFIRAKTRLIGAAFGQSSDRSQMAHSVDGRHPFCDHRLIELLSRIPFDLKHLNGQGKHLIREAMRPFISETIYRRPKHDFPAGKPISLLSGRMGDLLNDTLRGSALSGCPFFDRARVLALLDRTLRGEGTKEYSEFLFRILGTCLLQERFGLT